MRADRELRGRAYAELPYSCKKKRRYLLEFDAKQALASLQESRGASTVTVYKCWHCNQWHLGNKRLYTMNYEQLLRYAEDLEERLGISEPEPKAEG